MQMKKKMGVDQAANSFDFNSLLFELQTIILLLVLRDENLRYEFPKLFCVCKWWTTEHLDSPVARQLFGMEVVVVEGVVVVVVVQYGIRPVFKPISVSHSAEDTQERWYTNCVTNNLRMFSASIFPTVEFIDNRVSNASPVGLLHSGAIVKELGRIETTNGTYCVTANGCSRFMNEAGNVYLEPVDLRALGNLAARVWFGSVWFGSVWFGLFGLVWFGSACLA
jgi:hypothetical protein